ncbi:30S ribosomal protein S15 [Candidatus Bipolaricaulota bacterium]|jgi:small subunit ribosomal protein S15|nr:30S ribosomal protein S15 [Candidatus Bipolaricaulota bacterium]TFH09719.1 MAG: 30S ribosomal protein S15 [Candidatus Atribacteria bacterium]
MGLSVEKKAEIVKEFGKGDNDTGSAEVQIALLSTRISELTEHLNLHKKDFSSQRGLRKMVGLRRRLLKYVKRHNLATYRQLLERLGIRGV